MARPRTPYGLEIIQSCVACPVREHGLFCNLSPPAVGELNALRQSSVYPPGATLFVEGQPARGLFVLCSGRAKLTASSTGGRRLIVRMADTGEVLGLSAVVSNTNYETSAETLEPTQVNFLPRPEFLRFLQRHGEVSVRVAEHLSMELGRAYRQVARIALAPTARAKLAALLVEWAGHDSRPAAKGVRFQLRLTQEEVGELIGVSRETISRLYNDFRRRGLMQLKGTTVTLPDPRKLEALFT